MKNSILYILFSLVVFGCANGQDKPGDMNIVKLPKVKPGQAVATFGGGCFWAMGEALSELKGVDQVVAGFAGGTTKNPTYEEVCTRTTGHAETVQVYYDPAVISYEKLAEAFFYAHNPTELNYQGPDEGTDYRSIAFYRTPEEKAILLALIKKINASHHYNAPIVTQVVPFTVFYAAERYHQGYYRAHPSAGYIQSVSVPKVMKMRAMEKAFLKPEFQK
ncbi:peptide-methionine (S)-S-oxide reductase MsrA [Mucilaginibacter sp. UR6-11]|uniref:peptide-methionine (S)-S-oxide reductase MsrA n=1 Tax=Mucilaginibacter sp. UR6-11 TaxID=1435644 RepID=UPI001E3C5AE4|nr:peptide-methionine (S)-S-oxide reductase MsrA [Mucilaginibacter sp. UR6-11]MCC8426763.1 peptide-methionine (S)-S-oxide reductase MsrA [Mucilaginibacter sp. UR6-11]